MNWKMDEATNYAHTAIVNHEPCYLALQAAVARYNDADDEPLTPVIRDELRDTVERNAEAAGLFEDELDDVDFGAMIQWEAENTD